MRLFWDGFSGYTRTSVIIISPLRSVDPPQIEFPLYNCHCRLDDITFFGVLLASTQHSFAIASATAYSLLARRKEKRSEEKARKIPKSEKRTHEEAISPDQIYYVSR